ncbi:PAS domain-containing protein [Hymenobacter sp.]|uniref:PAS domain-containing protein n=1 Tax=Hymenobacter sp. TaxID=1898978 RepID=UPI00286CDBBF|nr:PAS domain-containing protein [Hymenobacter sp.]
MTPAASAPEFSSADGLLGALLDVSLSAVALLRPRYGPAGELMDFALHHLNPTAQRLTGLPERPAATVRTHFLDAPASGLLACCQRAWETGAAGPHAFSDQTGGRLLLAGRRSGEHLVLSFAEAGAPPRAAGDQDRAPGAGPPREASAHQLRLVTDALPVLIGYLDHERRYQFINHAYEVWFGQPMEQLLGRPVWEVVGQTAYAKVSGYLDRALAGERVEFEAQLPYREDLVRHMHVNYVPDVRAGAVVGVCTLVTDVTEQTDARRQVEDLNQALAFTNAELRAANAELSSSNVELARSKQAVFEAARRHVRERETRFQVFEHTPAAVCIQRGPDHRYEYVNAAYQAFFSDRQLLGRPVAEALPEAVDEGLVARLDHVYRTGETYFGYEQPLTLQQPDGRPATPMYFTFTYQAYRENGAIVGISTLAYDVGEQVRGREQRAAQQQAQQRQLREVFEQAPVAICVFRGAEYALDVVNPSMVDMLGRPLNELLGRPFFAAMPELVGQGLRELLDGVRRSGVPFVAQEQEIRLARHGPGETGFYNFVYQPLRDERGQVTAITCVATEVTAQVIARRVVERREESFRLMADNAPAMLWVTDPTGYCTYLNQPWYDYTGQTEAEALGLGWTGVVHPEDAEAAGTAFLAANARRAPFQGLYRLRRRDGAYRWAIDSGLPRFTETGEYAGIVGTVIDVHEQKLAEMALQRLTKKLRKSRDEAQALNAELRATNEQLTRTNVDLDNFIYTASHDLKAPISNIEGLLHTLRDELPAQSEAGEVTYILGLMQDSVNRFTRTIEHLTDLSKLQKEHDQPAARVPLAAVIEDVRLDLAPLLQQVGARLDVDVRKFSTVTFSEKNLRSVVYNLLSNALKYHHPDRPPEVRVRTRAEDGYYILEVHDNGLGLDLARERQLFTMFQRYHTHVEGSGVGLYMVKRMVENAGGKVEVHSQLGRGSVFSVYFKR